MQSEAVQDYVKQIYLLQAHSHKPATTNEIAEKMGVSAAAATAMVKKLAELGLVEHRPYHGAQLTDAGNRVAEHKDINANSFTMNIQVNQKTFYLMVGLEGGKVYTEKIGLQ